MIRARPTPPPSSTERRLTLFFSPEAYHGQHGNLLLTQNYVMPCDEEEGGMREHRGWRLGQKVGLILMWLLLFLLVVVVVLDNFCFAPCAGWTSVGRHTLNSFQVPTKTPTMPAPPTTRKKQCQPPGLLRSRAPRKATAICKTKKVSICPFFGDRTTLERTF